MDGQGKRIEFLGAGSHYRRLLRGGATGSGLENANGDGVDLSNSGIKNRLGATRAELGRIIDEYLGKDPGLHALADRIVADADTTLRMVRDDDEKLDEDSERLGQLEAIVRTDGSRPSFMIRNGAVDKSTSPVGTWEAVLDGSAEQLGKALSCVGRIDSDGSFVGTGFLIADNLVLTNRHVLQGIAARDANRVWRFGQDTNIDFGYEYRARESISPRALLKVLFFGPDAISSSGGVDHSKLDVVLIELAPAPQGAEPVEHLAVDIDPSWATEPDSAVFIVGYPGSPDLGVYPSTLLEELFKTTFKYKRLAPGMTLDRGELPPWTLSHDATTLGGNSGSVVMVVGRETTAAGIHYGGRRGLTAQNWGHVMGGVMDTQGAPLAALEPNSERTLRELLNASGVTLIDRAG